MNIVLDIFNVDSYDEVDLIEINPVFIKIDNVKTIVGENTSFRVRLELPIYGLREINFKAIKNDADKTFIYTEISAIDAALINALCFINMLEENHECHCNDSGCSKSKDI
jgi:hypothetical protein